MNEDRFNFDNMDTVKFPINPVVQALLTQISILKSRCPIEERESTKTWKIMHFYLREMLEEEVFDTPPSTREETDFQKLLLLTAKDDVYFIKAIPIFSNWRQLDGKELGYWIHKKHVAN